MKCLKMNGIDENTMVVFSTDHGHFLGHHGLIAKGPFHFEDMIRTNKDGYFPYTPATTLLRGLRVSIDMLLKEGLDNVFALHHLMAEGVRRAVDAWGLRLCAVEPKWHSDTVSAVMVPSSMASNNRLPRASKSMSRGPAIIWRASMARSPA